VRPRVNSTADDAKLDQPTERKKREERREKREESERARDRLLSPAAGMTRR